MYTLDAWRKLPRVGFMPDEHGGALELRNCAQCGSTLAMPVPYPGGSTTPPKLPD